jgi:hypothetical protein
MVTPESTGIQLVTDHRDRFSSKFFHTSKLSESRSVTKHVTRDPSHTIPSHFGHLRPELESLLTDHERYGLVHQGEQHP